MEKFKGLSEEECARKDGILRDGVCFVGGKPLKVGDKLMDWDESEIIEGIVSERIENPELYGFEGMSEEEIRHKTYETADLETEWDLLTENLDETLKKKNPGMCWHAEVKNFGWRGLEGEKTFCVGTASEFLGEILPKTECTFNIFEYGDDGIAIQNYHHDAPTGKEWYYVLPLRWEELEDDVWYNEGLGQYLMIKKADGTYNVEIQTEGSIHSEPIEVELTLKDARDFAYDYRYETAGE